MGKFIYGTPSVSVDFDDRVLAHLRAVIVAKLRRNESFTFSWDYEGAAGEGHSSVWLNPGIAVQFDFSNGRAPRLNKLWLDELVQLANTPAGLRIVPEPVPEGASSSS